MADDDYSPYDIAGKAYEPPRSAAERPGKKVDSEPLASQQLRSIIERMERLGEDKAAIADDEKNVMAEAKSLGFDNKAIRTIIRIRKKDPAKYAEETAILDTYLVALGMDPTGGAL